MDYIDSKLNELLDKKLNELIDKKLNDLIDNKFNNKSNNDSVIDNNLNKLIDKKLNDLKNSRDHDGFYDLSEYSDDSSIKNKVRNKIYSIQNKINTYLSGTTPLHTKDYFKDDDWDDVLPFG